MSETMKKKIIKDCIKALNAEEDLRDEVATVLQESLQKTKYLVLTLDAGDELVQHDAESAEEIAYDAGDWLYVSYQGYDKKEAKKAYDKAKSLSNWYLVKTVKMEECI